MKPIDLPSPEFMARFKPRQAPLQTPVKKPRRPLKIHNSPRDWRAYPPSRNHPVYVAAMKLRRFTTDEISKAAGVKYSIARAELYRMSVHGMIRVAEKSSPVPSTYERTDGLSFDGRSTNPAKLAIAAMPIGHRVGWADLPGSWSQKAAAIFLARRLGMVERKTFLRLFATWEISKAEE